MNERRIDVAAYWREHAEICVRATSDCNASGGSVRPTDEQVGALAKFARVILEAAREGVFWESDDMELVLVAGAEAGILGVTHVPDGVVVDKTLPDWLLETARQHTLTPEDDSRE